MKQKNIWIINYKNKYLNLKKKVKKKINYLNYFKNQFTMIIAIKY